MWCKPLTSQEKESIMDFVCKRLYEGDEYSEIERKICYCYSISYIKKMTQELIAQSRISRLDIIEARRRRRTTERRIGIPLVPEEKEEISRKILEMLENGRKSSGSTIEKCLNISASTANKMKKEIMLANGITKERVNEMREYRIRAETIYQAIAQGKKKSNIARRTGIEIYIITEIENMIRANELSEQEGIDLAFRILREVSLGKARILGEEGGITSCKIDIDLQLIEEYKARIKAEKKATSERGSIRDNPEIVVKVPPLEFKCQDYGMKEIVKEER